MDWTHAYDVIVAGGGPAGSTAATLLQRQGHRCLVLEGARFPRYHIGESLIPETYGPLSRLGLLPKLQASRFPEKRSVRFVSPSGVESTPFYFADAMPGARARTWQVERSQFDLLCLDNARASGVEVRSGCRVDAVLFDGDRAVGVRALLDGEMPTELRARVVVDASGRAGLIGRQLQLRREVPQLNKAAAWSYFRGGQRSGGIDAGETVVFLIPDRGWFWYIPLPDDMVSVGVVASPQYLFRDGFALDKVLQREIGLCAPLRERLASATQTQPERGMHRMAYLSREVVGNGWVMVGDAAGFLDPIYSSGLFLAMGSAALAADSIHTALSAGDTSASRLGAFVEPLWSGVEVVYRLIQAFYDPQFSFPAFNARFPEHRASLLHCLVGDVVGRDLSDFLAALSTMTPPPAPLRGLRAA